MQYSCLNLLKTFLDGRTPQFCNGHCTRGFSFDLQLHSRGTKTDVNVCHMLTFAATIAGKGLFRQLDISLIFKKIV